METGAHARQPWQTTLLSMVYLGFWCHLGVLTRVYLDRFVTLGCGVDEWLPCYVAGGAPDGLYTLYASPMVRMQQAFRV